MQEKTSKILIGIVLVLAVSGFSGTAYYFEQNNSTNEELQNLKLLSSKLNEIDSYLTARINYTPLIKDPPSLYQVLTTPRVGIVDITAYEQAPVLAAINVTGIVTINGFKYYVGTVGDHHVVDVRAGEKDSSAELATATMDNYFNITYAVLSGIGGSRNPYINTGDVAIGAFVINKGSIHFHNGNYETPYGGDEMVITSRSLLGNSLISGYGEVGPTISNASTYGYGPGAPSKNYVYVVALAASEELVKVASSFTSVGSISISELTGIQNATGSVNNKAVIAVISSGGFWTDPVYLNAEQNALYQGDVGENEGWGFAFANTQYGVPWVIIRGISNSHFYPNSFHGVLAAKRAAEVAVYLIEHVNSTLDLRQTATFSNLSPISEARVHGYIVANRVYFNSSGNVTEVQYTNQLGQQVTVYNPKEYPATLPSLND